jgi:hypothetical protein
LEGILVSTEVWRKRSNTATPAASGSSSSAHHATATPAASGSSSSSASSGENEEVSEVFFPCPKTEQNDVFRACDRLGVERPLAAMRNRRNGFLLSTADGRLRCELIEALTKGVHAGLREQDVCEGVKHLFPRAKA